MELTREDIKKKEEESFQLFLEMCRKVQKEKLPIKEARFYDRYKEENQTKFNRQY